MLIQYILGQLPYRLYSQIEDAPRDDDRKPFNTAEKRNTQTRRTYMT